MTENTKGDNAEGTKSGSTKSDSARNTRKDSDNTVYIGSKAVMNYVLAVVTQFNSGAGEVKIKARGRTISKAVDVAEIVRNRFVQSASLEGIEIGTERLTGDHGETNVSTIEIAMNAGNEKAAKK